MDFVLAARLPLRAFTVRALPAALAGWVCASVAYAQPAATVSFDLDAGRKLGAVSSSAKLAVTAPDIVGAKVEFKYAARSGASEQETFAARVVRSLDVPFVELTTLDARIMQSAQDGSNGSLRLNSALPAMDGWRLSTSVAGDFHDRQSESIGDEPFRLSDARLKLEGGATRFALEFGMRHNEDQARWDAALRRVIAAPLAARISVTAPIERDDRFEEGASFRVALERARG
jgi:hypothetical protein